MSLLSSLFSFFFQTLVKASKPWQHCYCCKGQRVDASLGRVSLLPDANNDPSTKASNRRWRSARLGPAWQRRWTSSRCSGIRFPASWSTNGRSIGSWSTSPDLETLLLFRSWFWIVRLKRITTTYSNNYIQLQLHTVTSTYSYIYIQLQLHTVTSTYSYIYIQLQLHTVTTTTTMTTSYNYSYMQLQLSETRIF